MKFVARPPIGASFFENFADATYEHLTVATTAVIKFFAAWINEVAESS